MKNETVNTEVLSENVKISFDNIIKVYEESSLLLKDLVAELEKIGFEKVKGNEISAYVSKHIDKPHNWLAGYAALSFKNKAEPDSKRPLFVTVIYFDLVPKAVEPYLIMGVCEMFDGGSWDYWWMHYAFFNGDNMFRYYGSDNKMLSIESPHLAWQSKKGEWGFKVPNDGATTWPKAGKLLAVPLLEIKSEDIGKLAERGAKLWKAKFVLDADNQ